MGEPLRAVRCAGCVKTHRGESGIRRSRCVPGRGRGGSRLVCRSRQGSAPSRGCSRWCSRSALCVIPMQDYMGLDNRSRINKPSTVGTNWKWRLAESDLTEVLKQEIRSMTLRYGRMNWS